MDQNCTMPLGLHKVSLAVISWNEEKNIARCLASVPWADEIVVVDSESQDQTQKIAAAMGAKVVVQPFLGHVAQKQLALSLCQNSWVLSLDADEVLSPVLFSKLLPYFEKEKIEVDGFQFHRRSFHLGRWIGYGGWYPDKKLRLVRKEKAHWSGQDPHDVLLISGRVEPISADIQHYVFRDLAHNVAQNNSYSSISAKKLNEQGVKFSFWMLFLKPPFTFFRLYFFRLGFLDGMAGLIIAVGGAYSQFLKFAKLWEIQRVKTKKEQGV